MAGGIGGITYSLKHKDEEDGKKFFAGYFSEVAVAVAVGFITGFAGEFLWGAKGVWKVTSLAARNLSPAAKATAIDAINYTISVGGEAVSGAMSSEINKIADNGIGSRSTTRILI